MKLLDFNNKDKIEGNAAIIQLALQEALRELQEQKQINHQLSIKVLVLQEKYDKIKEIIREVED